MFDRCFREGQFNQAIGLAIESRRLDKIRETIEKSANYEEKLSYTFNIAYQTVKSKDFRHEILRLLLAIYETREGGQFDYFKICKCQFFLSMPESTAILLQKLIQSEDYLIAYQVAFDIVDKENQYFSNIILQYIANNAVDAQYKDRIEKLKQILTGEVRDRLYL